MLRVKNECVTRTQGEIDGLSDGLVSRDTSMGLVTEWLVIGVGVEADAVAGNDRPHRDPNVDGG
jgi:hypothetical protein